MWISSSFQWRRCACLEYSISRCLRPKLVAGQSSSPVHVRKHPRVGDTGEPRYHQPAFDIGGSGKESHKKCMKSSFHITDGSIKIAI